MDDPIGQTEGRTFSSGAEESPVESVFRQRWQTLVEMIDEVVLILNGEGRYEFMNHQAAARLGGQPADFVGRHVGEMFPETADEYLACVQQVLRTGQLLRHEGTLELQGRRRWYRTDLHPLYEGHDSPQLVLAVSHDITPLREALDELEARDRQYRELIETLPVGITRVNYNHGTPRLEIVNPAILKLLGVQRSEDAGDFLVRDLHADPADFLTIVETIRREGFIEDYECEMNAEGRRFWMSLTAHAEFNEDGSIEYIDSMVHDITPRKLAQIALQDAHARLLHAREEERRHLAGELHDSLGQRLVALQLGLRSLGKVLDDKDAPQRLAARLAVTHEECSDLIREVRYICHGLYPPALESMGLAGALWQLAHGIRAGELDIELDCDEQLERQRLSRNVEIALFRISQEAINNAIRHGRAGQVKLSLQCSGDRVVLEIVDDGRGFRLDETAGNGMGLRNMRERADAIGAALHLESQAGRSLVRVTVPLEIARQDEAD